MQLPPDATMADVKAAITAFVATAPPFSPETRQLLADLFRPVPDPAVNPVKLATTDSRRSRPLATRPAEGACRCRPVGEQHPDQRPLLTEEELAAVLRVSRKTLQDWRYRRVGPKATHLGRAVRYRWVEVERYLDANT